MPTLNGPLVTLVLTVADMSIQSNSKSNRLGPQTLNRVLQALCQSKRPSSVNGGLKKYKCIYGGLFEVPYTIDVQGKGKHGIGSSP